LAQKLICATKNEVNPGQNEVYPGAGMPLKCSRFPIRNTRPIFPLDKPEAAQNEVYPDLGSSKKAFEKRGF